MAQFNKPISIDYPENEFSSTLSGNDNSRIIFSGVFGSGKTWFLKEYFRSNSNDYLSIHLFPTNYVSNQNEDVFELIKFDILFELLKSDPKFNNLKIDYLDVIPFLTNKDVAEVFKPLIEFIPKVGKAISAIIEPLEKLNEAIIKKKDSIEKEASESDKIKTFAQQIFNQKGIAYESNLYTDLITQLIARAKDKKSKKHSVLIIDDLDRIDPDNIFRLLNVFSVHFDLREGTSNNKFGFDTVIFCCDIENIRKIFQHRFGIDVDFNGYIDKFYTEIFHFDNTKRIKEAVELALSTVKLSKNLLWEQKAGGGFKSVKHLIEEMIESGTYNLRQLINLNESSIDEKFYKIHLKDSDERVEMYIFRLLDFFIRSYGNHNLLERAFRNTNFKVLRGNELSWLIVQCYILIDHKTNKLDTQISHHTFRNGDKYQIKISNSRNHWVSEIYGSIIQPENFTLSTVTLNDLLIESLKVYIKVRGTVIN